MSSYVCGTQCLHDMLVCFQTYTHSLSLSLSSGDGCESCPGLGVCPLLKFQRSQRCVHVGAGRVHVGAGRVHVGERWLWAVC